MWWRTSNGRLAGRTRLIVVTKANSGRSEAINVGVNTAREPLVALIDADSILEPDALVRVTQSFIDDPSRVGTAKGFVICPALGGRLRPDFVEPARDPDGQLLRCIGGGLRRCGHREGQEEQGGRAARGKPVIHCIAIRPDERVTALDYGEGMEPIHDASVVLAVPPWVAKELLPDLAAPSHFCAILSRSPLFLAPAKISLTLRRSLSSPLATPIKLGLSFKSNLYSVLSCGFFAMMLPATDAPVAITCT